MIGLILYIIGVHVALWRLHRRCRSHEAVTVAMAKGVQTLLVARMVQINTQEAQENEEEWQ